MEENLVGPIELFRRSFKTLIDRILIFIAIYLVAIGFQLISSFLGLGAVFFSFFGLQNFRLPIGFGNFKNFWLILAILVVYAIVTLTVHFWSQIAILTVIKNQSEKIGAIKAYKLGWKKLFSYSGSLILSIIAIFGGLTILIFPGIILGLWFSFVPMVVVFDNFGGLKAMAASREYVRGRFWAVVWRVIAYSLFVSLLGMIFSRLRSEAMFRIGIGYFTSILSYLFGLITIPLSIIYLTHLFLNLKKLKPEISVEINRQERLFFLIFIVVGLAAIIVLPTLFIRHLFPLLLGLN